MTLSLMQITAIAADVLRWQPPTGQVLGASNAEGAQDYAEVVIALDSTMPEAERMVIGVQRHDTESDIRRRVHDRLRARRMTRVKGRSPEGP